MSSRLRSGALQVLLPIVCFVFALSFARHLMNSTYHWYDDEGYFVSAFGHYVSGLRLYTEMFGQYGPFFFFVHRAMFYVLHLPVTHDGGRVIMLIFWMLSAVLAAVFVFRHTGNMWQTCAAGLAMTVLGKALAEEPGHPQQIILPLFMLACCATTMQSDLGWLLIGIVGAALAFTKINVGVFFFVAVLVVLVCGMHRGPLRRVGFSFVLLYALLAPPVLMHRHLHLWAETYIEIAVIVGVATFGMTGLVVEPISNNGRRAAFVMLGSTLTTLAIILGTMAQGMSPKTLIDGVLILPLHHPGIFEAPIHFRQWQVAFCALLSAIVIMFFRGSMRSEKYAAWLDAFRCVAGLVVLADLLMLPRAGFCFLGLLPLTLIPSHAARNGWEQLGRVFVTTLAAAQMLQAYPVAGSQIRIALAPTLLWCFLCIADGAPMLSAILMKKLEAHHARFAVSVALVLAIVVLMTLQASAFGSYAAPASSLYGMASMHMPVEQERVYEQLAGDIHANCDILTSMPGMYSFNAWSRVREPDGFNVTVWVKGLPLDEQMYTLQLLKTNPQACAVTNESLLKFWTTNKADISASPLASYINDRMCVVNSVGGYQLRVSPDRKSPWLSSAAR